MNAYMETLCVLFYTELDPFVSLLLSVSKPGPNLSPDLPAPELLSSGRVRGASAGWLVGIPSTRLTLSYRQSSGFSFVYENDLASLVTAEEVN